MRSETTSLPLRTGRQPEAAFPWRVDGYSPRRTFPNLRDGKCFGYGCRFLRLAVSDRGVTFSGGPLFAPSGAFGFLVPWVAFLPSFLRKAEHYYDLAECLTYLTPYHYP